MSVPIQLYCCSLNASPQTVDHVRFEALAVFTDVVLYCMSVLKDRGTVIIPNVMTDIPNNTVEHHKRLHSSFDHALGGRIILNCMLEK
jgi:hypothetical protein